MKKSILFLALLFGGFYAANAQAFEKGSAALNAGIGIGTALGGLGNARPAISVALDYGMVDVGGPGVISVGGYIGNTGYTYKSGDYKSTWNYNVIGARCAYHYNGLNNAEKYDLYAGLMLAYNMVKYKTNYENGIDGNTYGSGVGFSGFIGGRYFFSNNLGVYGELGYGVSYLNAGISLKF